MPFKFKVQRKLYMQKYRAKKKLQHNCDLESFLKAIDGCSECQSNPLVFITSEQIPLCRKHWYSLADSDIEWGNDNVEIYD